MSTRTVLHGVDQQGLSSARPTRANDGHVFFETDTLGQRVWDGAQAEWLPIENVPFVYDVSAGDDGTIGPHGLAKARLPAGSIILDGLVDIITSFAGAGASIAINVQGANDIVSVAAVASWAAGLKDIIPAGAAANAIKMTADRDVRITVSGGALTAGKLRGFLRILRSTVVVTEEESTSSSSSSSTSSSSSNSSSSSTSSNSSSSSSNSSSSSSSSS